MKNARWAETLIQNTRNSGCLCTESLCARRERSQYSLLRIALWLGADGNGHIAGCDLGQDLQGRKQWRGRQEDKPWHLQASFTSSAELISGSILLANASSSRCLNRHLSHHTTACHSRRRGSGLRQAALLGRVRCRHALNARWYPASRAVSEMCACRKGVTFLRARSHQPLVWSRQGAHNVANLEQKTQIHNFCFLYNDVWVDKTVLEPHRS